MPTTRTPATTTPIHVTALDGIVNVNALFTFAVFVGLSMSPGHRNRNLAISDACYAGRNVAEWLVLLEVVSFSFFLSSSLIAQGLKLTINLLNSNDKHDADKAHISMKLLRYGMLCSAVGSFMGFIFLMLSMTNVIQIRLGLLSCGRKNAISAVVALSILAFSALVAYIFTFGYAFLHKPSTVGPPVPKPSPTESSAAH